MSKQITKYQCDYCRKSYMRRKATAEHEGVCFYNPDRTPRDCELALFSNIPRQLLVEDSYGVPGSNFHSIIEPWGDAEETLMEKFKWWPRESDGDIGLGYVWLDGKWNKIKGYEWPNLAPGFSFKEEVLPNGFRLCYDEDDFREFI